MIMNQTDTKISALLQVLHLSGYEADIAEQYLAGEAEEEELGKLQARDLSGYSWDERNKIEGVFDYFRTRDQKDKGIRLFNLLFAIGKDTCSEMISWKIIRGEENCALYKRAAVYLRGILPGAGRRMYLRNEFSVLLDMAKNNPQKVKEAAGFLEGYDERYKIIFLALYFAMKYPEVSQVAEDDLLLMKEYEMLTVKCLEQGLMQYNCVMHKETAEAVRSSTLTEELLEKINTGEPADPASDTLFFTSRMAYMNFHFSPILKNVITVCLALDKVRTLLSFMWTGLGENSRTDIAYNGADYDEEFHIDPETYIRWAALAEYKNILKRQLEKNKEIYLASLDEEGFAFISKKTNSFLYNKAIKAVNVLKDVIKEEDPKLYQQVVTQNTDHSRVIDTLVLDAPHAGIAKEYLLGNCEISELYPYAEEFEDNNVMDYLDSYKEHCIDEGFFNRCKAFMVLRNSSYTRVVDDGGESAQKVEEFFQILENEKMDLTHLLAAFAELYKQSWRRYYRKCSDEVLLEGAINIFSRYLDEKREETLAAFKDAKSEGRFLALRVLRAEAEKNKKEILSYVSDTSKMIKEEFFEIVRDKKEWEEDVKELLTEKKQL